MELHGLFEEYLGEDEIDKYPEEPSSMSKEQVRELLQEMNGEGDDDDFEQQFEWIDFDHSGSLEFDEFLDFLDPEIIREPKPKGKKKKGVHLKKLRRLVLDVQDFIAAYFTISGTGAG
jgi:Ca2+-binding EF-hand superfamily protein